MGGKVAIESLIAMNEKPQNRTSMKKSSKFTVPHARRRPRHQKISKMGFRPKVLVPKGAYRLLEPDLNLFSHMVEGRP